MLGQTTFFSLCESSFNQVALLSSLLLQQFVYWNCFLSPSTICLSKLAYVVAELKQNLPLDHAGTALVAVNGHFPFVHQRLVRNLHQHRQLDSQAVVQIGWRQ